MSAIEVILAGVNILRIHFACYYRMKIRRVMLCDQVEFAQKGSSEREVFTWIVSRFRASSPYEKQGSSELNVSVKFLLG